MIRLFVAGDLAAGEPVALDAAQAHYLGAVMRLAVGEEIYAFNGRDGEWRARLVDLGRKGGTLEATNRVRGQAPTPDLELIVAVVKRPRLEIVVEKAAELGVRRLRPALTARTNGGRVNLGRLTAIAAEAAEQTGRLDVPEILSPAKLTTILDRWERGRRLMFCDEAGEAAPAWDALAGDAPGPWAILIGPEGGFSAEERARVRALPGALPVSLGPRILRADTAAIVAIALWQSALGDWRGP
ncbi:MAG: 16S rRNA (uracil(1498)-N(3))-methyltransferase [Caulobacteraceae bacterium]